MRIKVFLFGDDPRSGAHHYVSKSTAARWHDWGTHIWLDRHSIQERYPEPFKAIAGRKIPPAITRYSPDKFPCLDLPGVHFHEPDSATWKLAHRKVTFPAQED